MKKILVVMSVLLVFAITVAAIGCSVNRSNTGTPNPQPGAATATPAPTSTPGTTNIGGAASTGFTLDELKRYNGQNNNPAYVAVDKTVYDVTNARKWKSGRHVDNIVAGVDLTNAMGESPHGNSVLKDLPVVGTLK